MNKQIKTKFCQKQALSVPRTWTELAWQLQLCTHGTHYHLIILYTPLKDIWKPLSSDLWTWSQQRLYILRL